MLSHVKGRYGLQMGRKYSGPYYYYSRLGISLPPREIAVIQGCVHATTTTTTISNKKPPSGKRRKALAQPRSQGEVQWAAYRGRE